MNTKKRFKLTFSEQSKIGSGCFGEVFLGICDQTKEEVAIKKESISVQPPQLLYEMRLLKTVNGAPGFPIFRGYWPESGYNCLAQSLLGYNMNDLFFKCGKRFTLKTVLMIAEQMITRLNYLHSKDTLHRDIKPENFMIGRGSSENVIYLIDFGLTKPYRDSISHIHIPFREGRPMVGTARYVSINTHLGYESSRRDDLESLAYLLVYFMKGRLPWQGFKSHSKAAKYAMILEKKRSVSPSELCEGLPNAFLQFLEETRKLEFDEEPNYSRYRELFRNALINEGYSYDYDFCWAEVKDLPIPVQNQKKKKKKEKDYTSESNAFMKTSPLIFKPNTFFGNQAMSALNIHRGSHHVHHHLHQQHSSHHANITPNHSGNTVLNLWRKNLVF